MPISSMNMIGAGVVPRTTVGTHGTSTSVMVNSTTATASTAVAL